MCHVAAGHDIFVMNSDGTGRRKLTVAGELEWNRHPSWSPDGTQIVFWSNRETGHKQIWVMCADGSGKRNISNNPSNEWDPVWIKGL
ncbi:MAG: hypothetical protein WBW48_24640 [Anaerolineae bacterium]